MAPQGAWSEIDVDAWRSSSGATPETELDALEAEVEQAARARTNVSYQTRIHQVWGRRPTEPPSA